MSQFDVLIVGAGQAGVQVAASLRQGGYTGSVGVVGEQAEPPYELPPLSKDYMAGDKAFEQMLLRGANFWADQDIALHLGSRITAVDPMAHAAFDSEARRYGYGKLVWATGGRPRSLTCPGAALPGVHGIRTRADVDRLRGELQAAGDIVVIGGGYIGLEAAAVFVGLGKRVVVLEAMTRVLSRVAGETLSRFYEREHRARGAQVRTGVTVSGLQERGGRVAGVVLAHGEVVLADLVVVGIGIVPAVEPLRAAGAKGINGVDVDPFCRTSLPDVYAVGDVADHESVFAGGARVRLESVQNANDQAKVVARALLGEPKPYEAVPWFWSSQYDLRLQTVGLSTGFDETITRGEPATRSFSVVYLRRGRVIALDCVNATRDYVQGKALVQRGARPLRDRIANPSVPLNACEGRVVG